MSVVFLSEQKLCVSSLGSLVLSVIDPKDAVKWRSWDESVHLHLWRVIQHQSTSLMTIGFSKFEVMILRKNGIKLEFYFWLRLNILGIED